MTDSANETSNAEESDKSGVESKEILNIDSGQIHLEEYEMGYVPNQASEAGDKGVTKKKKNSSLRCQYRCTSRFKDQEQRRLHYLEQHSGEDLPILTCSYCGKTGFKWDCTLKQHVTETHLREAAIFVCEFCEKIFTRRDSYKEHLLIHKGPRHKCSHCEKEFVQRSNLIRHERIHTGTKPYKCSYCSASFSDQGACKSHENVHTKEQACVCVYCGQQFSKHQKLRYHLRKHTGEGLVSCNICQKSFTNNSSLKIHLETHKTKKPSIIKCPYECGKVFTHERNMKKHVDLMHEKVNFVQCQICLRVLSAHTSLRNHMLCHTGVKHLVCLICKKSYSELPGVRYHLLTKHNIPRKHPLFLQCFYKMTLKEIGIMEKFNNDRRGKKMERGQNGEKATISETIQTLLNDVLSPDVEESGTEAEVKTENLETIKQGGKTFLIAPERGIGIPEFYEKSAPDKKSLDKKISEKVRDLKPVLDDYLRRENERSTETLITISGSLERITDVVKELDSESGVEIESVSIKSVNKIPRIEEVEDITDILEVLVQKSDDVELENGTHFVRLTCEQFSAVTKQKSEDIYMTGSGVKLIKLNDWNYKIDMRGRPRGSFKNAEVEEFGQMADALGMLLQ